jgi:hypothetical protein
MHLLLPSEQKQLLAADWPAESAANLSQAATE